MTMTYWTDRHIIRPISREEAMRKDAIPFSYKAFPYMFMVKQISHCGKWLVQALTLN